MHRSTAIFLGFLVSTAAHAQATLPICYGYGCVAQAQIHYSPQQLQEISSVMSAAVDAESERNLLAQAIGRLYRWAGEQSDIHNDRGGNFADGHVSGKMDCIDHSQSTTRLLRLLAERGDLRWHRVLPREGRYFLGLVINHWSAVIEENAVATEVGSAPRFVVDSWFVNNGEPAVILPLDEWKKGAGPDV